MPAREGEAMSKDPRAVGALADRVERRVEQTGELEVLEAMTRRGYMRWSMDARWVEFACGCRAERVHLTTRPHKWEPVIFEGLPEEAVYDYVCHAHEPEMNKRIGLGGYRTFAQWRTYGRSRLVR